MTFFTLYLLTALLLCLGRTANVNDGIVNGTEAKPHSRPYMVSIQRNGRHICGGFLVTTEFVMTAAHCWNKISILTAVLGAHDLSDWKDGSTPFQVETYHVHPEYNIATFDNDIMLLKLHGKTKLSKTIQVISIPQKEENIPASSVCSIAGWGKTGTSKQYSNRLLETHVKIIDRTGCNKHWNMTLTSRMVCALYPGGTCWGDSGGPLVCNNTAVGIVSFGDPKTCDSPSKPDVYTKISAILPWINSILNPDGFQSNK